MELQVTLVGEEYRLAPRGKIKSSMKEVFLLITMPLGYLVLMTWYLSLGPFAPEFGVFLFSLLSLIFFDLLMGGNIEWGLSMVLNPITWLLKRYSPVYINPQTREVRRRKEILIDHVPKDAKAIIKRNFQTTRTQHGGGEDEALYSIDHYSIQWQLSIEASSDKVLLFRFSDKMILDRYKPRRITCDWMEAAAEKVAELLNIPLVDNTGDESIVIKPEQLKKPFVNQLKESKSW